MNLEQTAFEGWQHETELSQTVGVTYSTGYEDSVVLTSSPYIRYYYQQWNPKTRVWEDVFYDVPMTPRTTMISVDMYDEVAVENNWKTLRDTALGGSIAGRPETYRSEVPNPESWNLTDFKSKKTEWQEVGSGSMTQTMTHERTPGHGVTWGVTGGAALDAQIAIFTVHAIPAA